MQPKLVIWGAGSQARVVADIIGMRGDYELAGFLDDINPRRHGTPFCGATILGGKEQLEWLRSDGVQDVTLGIGNSRARLSMAELVVAKGFALATAIHPSAIIAHDVSIGPGTVIKAGAIIDTAVNIGANVIIGAGTTVAHGCIIADGSRLSGGVNLGGKVRVGQGAWLGVGVSVKDRIAIGAGSLVGVGAAVISDLPSGMVAYGVPARVVRRVKENEG